MLPRTKKEDLVRFTSQRSFHQPDLTAYQAAKGIRMIEPPLDEFPRAQLAPWTLPVPPMFAHNEWERAAWEHLWAPRLAAAAIARHGNWLTPFPGHTLPAPGGNGATIHVGALAVDRFSHIASHLLCASAHTRPEPAVENVPLCASWPWQYVPQPQLHLLTPHAGKDHLRASAWLSSVSPEREPRITRASLASVQNLWSRHTRQRPFDATSVEAGTWILRQMDQIGRAWGPGPFLFELEWALAQMQGNRRLNIHSQGCFGGCWVEVGELPLSRIQCAELAVTRRVVQELVTIRKSGFAPLVVNEYGSDTDGTHRLTAAWLWNLLRELAEQGIELRFNDLRLQQGVARFVDAHASAMGPLIVREALRTLGEMISDEETLRVLHSEVLPFVLQFHPVRTLPVLLLLEAKAATVLKAPFDEGREMMRVDPLVYEVLSTDRAATLPARGPYHRTDRIPLPWFTVLQPL